MVIGDPYGFAFVIDVVSEWRVEESPFIQGIFFMCIDGELFPKNIEMTTLSSDVWGVLKGGNPSPALISIPANNRLFSIEKKRAFLEMYNLATAGGLAEDESCYRENDYTYKASCTTMEDNACYVFVVSDGKQVRILGGQIKIHRDENNYVTYAPPEKISEVYLPKEILEQYVSELRYFYNKNIMVSHPNVQ